MSHLNPLSPIESSATRRRPARLLVLAGLSLTVAAALLGRTLGVLVLPLAASALGAAAALGLRVPRTPAAAAAGNLPAPPVPAATDAVDDGELTTLLARLHDDHVEQVNHAVSEGREDLLQELSNSYLKQAMALMTGAGLPPARAEQQLAA